jgi:hypothetical protein
MLDPLIALGAVANVTQFVELEDISVLSRKLQESLTTTAASSSFTTDEQALCDLCKGCIDVSQELTKALEKLIGQGKLGRFRSFRQALKNVWSKDDIDNLERRVKMYKEELNIRIIVGLRFVPRLSSPDRSNSRQQEQDRHHSTSAIRRLCFTC